MNLAFHRVAIVNRGEPAMRLLHAIRELNEQHGLDLKTIALFTEPDRHSMFVREADEAICLGPATFVDPRDGERKIKYLDYEALDNALVEGRAQAAWVGWGFVAEHAEFADLCQRRGVVFIGPSGDVMRQVGDKIASKLLAEGADVPVAPWSGGPVADLEAAQQHAQELGFPLMIKATAGGGGRGVRRVKSADELSAAFASAQSEALKFFGSATVFLERAIVGARHIEVQVLADFHGNCWAVGVRDCTIQRRNQKVLEEAGKKPGEVVAGGIDLTPQTIDGLKSGYVSATLDQQLYLQGFLPVLQIVLTKQYGFAGLYINTGAGVVTPQTIDALVPLIDAGIR